MTATRLDNPRGALSIWTGQCNNPLSECDHEIHVLAPSSEGDGDQISARCGRCGRISTLTEREPIAGQPVPDGGGPASGKDRVMVDIETVGLEPGAAIVSIGAVRFDTDGLGEEFQRSIALASCQEAGLRLDAETIGWWLDQDPAVQEQLTGGDDLRAVLAEFSAWYGDADEIWANSPSFDCEMLERAYSAVGQDEPWGFQDERDYRTLRALGVDGRASRQGDAHDALADARYQASMASDILTQLGVNEVPELVTDGGGVAIYPDPEPVACDLTDPDCQHPAVYAADVALAADETREVPACRDCAEQFAAAVGNDWSDVRELPASERWIDRDPEPGHRIVSDGGVILWSCPECDRDRINSRVNPERCPSCRAERGGR